MRFAKSVLSFLAVIALAAGLAAQPAAPAPKAKPAVRALPAPVKVTSVEGITEYVLGNGLHVLLFPDPGKPTITVNVTYAVGSRNENYGETGMAHLLEHLMFKGSTKHPNIPQELTAHGARPNGSTWYDRTNYFETFQATDENLRWALELEADRMVNSFIAKKDLDSEMTVVRNEFEAGENDPESVLGERVLSTAYLWHNYGKSTIGARADLENVPIERLQAFWRTYYQPDNAYLLVAGRFDESKTLALVNEIFGPIPRPKRTIPVTYTAEPVQDGEREVTLRRVGDVQAVAVAYHVPSGPHPDSAAVDIVGQVLADTPSGRLYKALVETKKATSVGDFFLYLHDPGFLLFSAQVRQESSLDEAQKTMLATIDAIPSNPITKEEVDRARAEMLKNIDLTLNSADRVGLELSEWIGAGDWRLFFLNRDRIKKVTAEDAQRVAVEYLKPSNRTVGLFIPTAKPDRSEIPPSPDAAALLKDYKGEAAVAQGEAFDPSPANIESKTTRTKLANGLQVALLPKKTRGATVVAAATLRFGDEKSLMNKSVTADLAADMLLRGTAKHTRQQLKDEFDRLKARVAVSGGPTQASFSVETVRENLPAVLKLVAEVLREPAFPENEFEQLKQENLAGIEQQKSEPDAVAQNAFGRHMNPYPKGDVRYTETPGRGAGELQGRDPGGHEEVPRGLLRGLGRGAGGRRRLRSEGNPGSGGNSLRRLEEPSRLRARGSPVPGRGRRERDVQDAGQGERLLHLRREPPDGGRRPGLPGDGARELPVRRRLPELPTRRADPTEGGLELRRRLAVRRLAAGQVRGPDRLRHLRAAERREAREGLPRGARPGPERRLHRAGSHGRKERLPPGPAGLPRPGRKPRPDPLAGSLPEADALLGRGVREAGRRSDARGHRRRDAAPHRSGEVHFRQGRRLRQEPAGGGPGEVVGGRHPERQRGIPDSAGSAPRRGSPRFLGRRPRNDRRNEPYRISLL